MKNIVTKLLALSVMALALVSTSVAYAQEDTVVRGEDKTVFKTKTVIDFSDVNITGELTKPEGQYLLNRKETNFKSLLKARPHFIDELEASIEGL